MSKSVIKVHDRVESGSLVVGDPDSSRSQYTELGGAKRTSTLYGGEHQQQLYINHAKSNGKPLPRVSVNLQHAGSAQPTAPSVEAVPPKAKAKLAPTPKKKKVELTNSISEEPKHPLAQTPAATHSSPKLEEDQYTVVFHSAMGKNKANVLDVIKSDGGNAIALLFRDEDAVTFEPQPGDVFDITYTSKLFNRQTTPARVFSPNLIYSLPDSSKKLMVLVNAPENDGSEED